MGKLGRFACIFVPIALTIASLICLVLVFLGQTNKNMDVQNDLYFFKANAKDFNNNPNIDVPDIPNFEFDNELLAALQGISKNSELKDFYKVGLWNYCEGDINDKGEEKVTFCSKRKSQFYFDFINVWGLNETAEEYFGNDIRDAVDVYRKVSKWMFVAYVVAIILTAVEFVVGIFAIFSRWGSLVTTIVSTAQTVFIIAAAATSTALYATLTGVFKTTLGPYNIDPSMGTKMLSVVWIGVAFSIASGFFWLISVCCCSGKSPHKKTTVEKTPYTYERVASPYLGARAGDHQMHHMPPSSGHGTSGSAYEPYRHN